MLMTDERSLAICLLSQIFCTTITLLVNVALPVSQAHTFQCPPRLRGDVIMQRPLYVYCVVAPYFVSFILSFICALYVVKIAIQQSNQVLLLRLFFWGVWGKTQLCLKLSFKPKLSYIFHETLVSGLNLA